MWIRGIGGMWYVECGLRYVDYVDVESQYSICGLCCQQLTGYVDCGILL